MTLTLDEQLVTLAEVAALLPKRAGKKCSVSAIWRWCDRGVRGVRLESIRIGGSIWTSREALQRFLDRVTELGARRQHRRSAPSVSASPPRRGARQRARDHQRAALRLKRAGI